MQEKTNEFTTFSVDTTEDRDDWDSICMSRVYGFIKFLSEYKSCFFYKVFSIIFSHSDVLFEGLQKKPPNIAYCNNEIAKDQ